MNQIMMMKNKIRIVTKCSQLANTEIGIFRISGIVSVNLRLLSEKRDGLQDQHFSHGDFRHGVGGQGD